MGINLVKTQLEYYDVVAIHLVGIDHVSHGS